MIVQIEEIKLVSQCLEPPRVRDPDPGPEKKNAKDAQGSKEDRHGRLAVAVLAFGNPCGCKVGASFVVHMWLEDCTKMFDSCLCRECKQGCEGQLQRWPGGVHNKAARRKYATVMAAQVLIVCKTAGSGEPSQHLLTGHDPSSAEELTWLVQHGMEVAEWVDCCFCSRSAPPRPTREGKLQIRAYYPSAENTANQQI